MTTYLQKVLSNQKRLPRLSFEEPNKVILSYWIPGRYQLRQYFTFNINNVPKACDIDDEFLKTIFENFSITNTLVWSLPTSRKKYVIPKTKGLAKLNSLW